MRDESNHALEVQSCLKIVPSRGMGTVDHIQSLAYFLGVFLVKTNNAFVPVERVYSVNTYIFMNFIVPRVSERSE